MVTRMVYVVGPMGSGKSTFMQQLLDRIGASLGGTEELFVGQNSRGSRLVLRGHRDGSLTYLGKLREVHPGQDGLDRASVVLLGPWLREEQPAVVVTEGRLFCSERAREVIVRDTDPLLIKLDTDDLVLELRFLQRGTSQKWAAVHGTRSMARNCAEYFRENGAAVLEVESTDAAAWEQALTAAVNHVKEEL